MLIILFDLTLYQFLSILYFGILDSLNFLLIILCFFCVILRLIFVSMYVHLLKIDDFCIMHPLRGIMLLS
jgi:hypothetical protein